MPAATEKGETMQLAHIKPQAADPEVIRLPVRFDADAAKEMEDSVLFAVKIGPHDMILDAADTAYITASGVRAFISLAKELKAAGGRLAICNLQPQAKELFDACGLAAVIPAYSHRGEAAAKMAA